MCYCFSIEEEKDISLDLTFASNRRLPLLFFPLTYFVIARNRIVTSENKSERERERKKVFIHISLDVLNTSLLVPFRFFNPNTTAAILVSGVCILLPASSFFFFLSLSLSACERAHILHQAVFFLRSDDIR